MSLAPGEQRTLVAIESQLRRSDPGLAAIFQLLAAGGIRNRAVCWYLQRSVRTPGGRAWITAGLVVGVALFAARVAGALAEAASVGLP